MQHWCLGRRLSVHMDENYGISKTIQERTNKATNVLLDKAGQDSRNISKVKDQLIYSDSFPSKPNRSVIVVCTDTLNQRGNAPMYRTQHLQSRCESNHTEENAEKQF